MVPRHPEHLPPQTRSLRRRLRPDQRKNLALLGETISKKAEEAEVERVANAFQGFWAENFTHSGLVCCFTREPKLNSLS